MKKQMENGSDTVKANPSKRFFVDMLTRDIELQDSILDLLDNCIDGLQRSRQSTLEQEKPFEGYWATIDFTRRKFQVIDNCGGIPLDLAKRYAFMLGRPRDEDDVDLPTVGMYGIGMKRAIFKMGLSSRVSSQTSTEAFEVTISPKWLINDYDWELPLKFINKPREHNGTAIYIGDLKDGVSKQFGNTAFATNLCSLISHHYAVIINKGFKVFVNSQEIKSRHLTLLWSDSKVPPDQKITPYLYRANLDDVEIRLAVGFYTPMIKPDDLNDEQMTRRSKEDAGWTVICNDRVIVHNDKTRLTGWGEASVPAYHSQFIGITGIVEFRSNNAWKLPITTTKRGVDTSSELYLYIKDFMREGLKKFTNYTNNWKADPVNEKEISSKAQSVTLDEIFAIPKDKDWTKVKNRSNERKFNFPLAEPKEDDPRKLIRFTRYTSEIRRVSEYLFDDASASPAEVGETCFNKILKNAEEK